MKTDFDKKMLKLRKKQYEEGMRKMLGDNWKRESRKLKLYNVMTLREE